MADLQSLPTIKRGNKSWGVYVNVPKTDDEARLYVGSTFARAGFKGRMKQHRAMPDPSSKGPRSGRRGKHANWIIKHNAEISFKALAVFPKEKHWKPFIRFVEGLFMVILNIVEKGFNTGVDKTLAGIRAGCPGLPDFQVIGLN